jgi:hypothetical protein
MARINGTPTANLSVPQFSPKDDLNKSTFNELLRTLDTRINIVADETQALVEHEANTAGVHGIADTSDLVVTTDTPADGEVLTYTTAGGVNWAAAAAGTDVVFAADSQLYTPTTTTNVINDWTTLVSNGATCDGTIITLAESGVYEVSYAGSLYNNDSNPSSGSLNIKQSAAIDNFTFYNTSSNLEIAATGLQSYSGNFARPFVANDTLVLTTGTNPFAYWNGSSNRRHSIVIRKIG